MVPPGTKVEVHENQGNEQRGIPTHKMVGTWAQQKTTTAATTSTSQALEANDTQTPLEFFHKKQHYHFAHPPTLLFKQRV